jgi:hypothetical protein
MKRTIKSVLKDKTHDIGEFERHLASTLKPVLPPDQFVRELREKLIVQIQQAQPENKMGTRKLILVILTGLLSVILVIATTARLIISLLVGMRVFDRMRGRGTEKQHPIPKKEEGEQVSI